jgi:2-keto-4-pentenoate hydratase
MTPARAEGDHADHADHAHAAKKAGPNGGRILTEVEPHLELFVTKDRKIRITPVDEANKPAALTGQSVKLTGGSRAKPTRMSFKEEGGVLVSDIALPEGKNIPVVLQIKPEADAKTVIVRFNLNLNDCPTCEHPEYACTCTH